MAAKNEKDLSDQLRSSWLKAVAAIELRNFAYAIDLLQNLLRQEPEFLTGRQMLRRAEVTRAKTEKKGFFNISTAPLAVMKAQRELKKDPRKTIELVEKVLETGPYNSQANMLLKDATSRCCTSSAVFIGNTTKAKRRSKFTTVSRRLTPSISKRSSSVRTRPPVPR
jgi:hypothetical protein